MTLDDVAKSVSGQLAEELVLKIGNYKPDSDEESRVRLITVRGSSAEVVLRKTRSLLPEGFIAFIRRPGNLISDTENKRRELVIAQAADQFEILRIAKTAAPNYDLDTESIIRKLRRYHADYGIDILHALDDRLEFDLLTVPTNLTSFCKDLDEFCPDNTPKYGELEEQIRQTRRLFLWWD